MRTETSGMCSTQKRVADDIENFFYFVPFVSQHWKITYKNTLENYFVNSMKNVGMVFGRGKQIPQIDVNWIINVRILVCAEIQLLSDYYIEWCVCWCIHRKKI